MLKRLIAACVLASAAFVSVSIPTFTTAPAAADEQMALFECADLGNGWAVCETPDGDLFMLRTD